jgi:hypothetical protein
VVTELFHAQFAGMTSRRAVIAGWMEKKARRSDFGPDGSAYGDRAYTRTRSHPERRFGSSNWTALPWMCSCNMRTPRNRVQSWLCKWTPPTTTQGVFSLD